MIVKLVIFGRPGSGKSASARYISTLTQQKGLTAVSINDYNILLEMFYADVNQKKFLPTTYAEGGFDIIDFSVLNDALINVERMAQENIDSKQYNLIMLELARADYNEAIKQFSSKFLQDAYFLLIYTDIKTCINRINERAAHPVTPDDHYVSDKIMHAYYQKDNLLDMPSSLVLEHKVPGTRIRFIDNTRSKQAFTRKLDQFIESIAELKIYVLPETDPLQPTVSVVTENILKCEQ